MSQVISRNVEMSTDIVVGAWCFGGNIGTNALSDLVVELHNSYPGRFLDLYFHQLPGEGFGLFFKFKTKTVHDTAPLGDASKMMRERFESDYLGFNSFSGPIYSLKMD